VSNPGEYEVPLPDLQRIWRQDISPIVFAGLAVADRPLALFVGAQPGAGKSRAMRRLEDLYPERTFVALDSDELRKFHPRLDDILRTDPARMPVLTNQAASAWFRMGLAQARHQGNDVLIENSFHNPDVIVAEAQQFKAAGYQTHAVALAVPGRDSRLGALTRYVDALTAGETARWTNLASHEAGYTGVPETAAALEASPSIDRMTITDRTGTIHYDHQHGPGRWADARRTVAKLRDQPPTVDQARAWLDNWTAVTTKISDLPSLDLAQAQPLLAALSADADILTAAVSPAAGSTYDIDSSPATVDDPQMTVDPPKQRRHPRL